MKYDAKKTVRYAALQALERIQKGGAYSNLLLKEEIEKGQLSDQDSRLLTELVYGTVSRQLLLEFYLQPFIAKAKKVDAWVKLLLELSLYQLYYLDRVPDHAVLNEAVEIAKVRGNAGIGKFVNGILRNVKRQGLPDPSQISDPINRLATQISMPKWLTERLTEEIGFEQTKQLGLSLFSPSHVSLRVDTRKISREEALDSLAAEGIDATESTVSEYGIIAEKGFVGKSRLFKEGLLTVQDETSMLVAPALQIEKQQQVLDACSAPGGKTTHIASFLDAQENGRVTALDIHEHKIQLIKENAARMQVEDVVNTRQLDARKVSNTFAATSFDRILVDAPCSGLGLMRRKPDIKYVKKPDDLPKLAQIQLEILESVAPTLKPSGILVYSTCTILTEENQQVIDQFLQKHAEFERMEVPLNKQLKPSLHDKMVTIYPHQYYTDGFFISCLRKKR
ncbi:16S rRNA (cytosine(967)-C(5))-methyltransferase RsmB [Tetragenococcus koreensis]|uniref:16S rRNA (cytosine(967)-C(5))-methyltransferase RsmB n=1 Tax=Tetragenococcus koreensis TaxID=290335 RepID=UPI000F4DBA79|nr:16S rRNA (cytosine(967)-C(5))-methyltransferase RsmB [Tetragenococcus koreensis]AYW46268.1 16S rRNA (cytosine(967)-C(5))-methyltransferase [Tetragenococcus koreensis]MCF1585028.1 16S rRNA (cytosine(967)-C(5))-methyltransferase RsmB [Tetragenococcus koreensis]MCF1614591.1 16S rRNA (cytosine(967)-C(5))-methyltransferase RsmB [Tetragenococcus koreensis]MCF1619415.1 16S rRNA (cytosine(967)-C(5))-methyltransferase RsmB [Tetragenococcus koreensis]MCF1624374.1 16S rRNA (cytosine(967)-C(5))-methylt